MLHDVSIHIVMHNMLNEGVNCDLIKCEVSVGYCSDSRKI